MRLGEARIPTQADYDLWEHKDRSIQGVPRNNWLYRHRESCRERKADLDLFAPFQDPVTGKMSPVTFPNYEPTKNTRPSDRHRVVKVSKEVKELTEQLRDPPRPAWNNLLDSLFSPRLKLSGPHESPWKELEEEAKKKSKEAAERRAWYEWVRGMSPEGQRYQIEIRPVPENLLVNREIYLGEIRQLMRERAIFSDAEFEAQKPSLIRHALYRMGKL